MPCLLTILAATGDHEADPFRLVANALMRTVTAAQQVARQAPTLTPGDGGSSEGQTWSGRVAPIVTHGAGFVTVEDTANVPTIFDDPAEVRVPGFWILPILFFD